MTPPPAELFASRVFLGPALRAQPDRRLVDLVRDGYDAAFEEIVRRYRRPLDRFAAAIVGGRSEDVTQDAFSKALAALRGSEAEIELRPWLYRIVRNTALNDLRDRGPVPEELAETLPGGRSAAAEAEAREEIRDLMGRLQALPEPQRAALVMRELEGLSHEEIAAALGVSGGAARQAIFRARAALRDGLGLLMPMPVLRALADHGGEAVGAGAVTAGALKVGLATVLVAGTVGAGVAIDRHQGHRAGPEAAEAAPLVREAKGSSTGGEPDSQSTAGSGRSRGDGSGEGHEDGGRGRGEDGGDASSLGDGRGSGSSDSSDSGGRSGGDHSGHGGSGSGAIDNSGPGSRHGGDDDGGEARGDHSGPGSGSDDGGSEDHSGSSGDSGGETESGGDHSGPGSGEEVVGEPVPTTEPEIEDGGDSGSGSGSNSGSGSGGDDLSGETSNLDGSP
jgi:RNA polymerase sigma factor (sigma-70 family)